MNFIRLPSLRLNHDPDKIEKEVISFNNYHHISKDSSHLLPPKWRSEHSQQGHYHNHQYQQYITTSNENDPLSSSSSIQIKLKPYSQQYGQSYAQEMIPYPITNDHLITSSPSSSSNNSNNNNMNRLYVKRRRRPPHSYASMIAQAILNSKEQKMTLRDIYNWVQEKYPHLYESNETGWQNTIRHNLSLNRCFYKLPKSSSRGKGSYWTIDMQQLYHTTFGHYLLDTYSTSRGFEYWSNESPLSSSSSTISTTSFSSPSSNSNFITNRSMMDIDDDKDINQSQHDSSCSENVDENVIDDHHQNKSNLASSSFNNNDNNNFIQPASIITLQHHQQHLKLSKSIPSFISKSKNHSSRHSIKHSTSHPNSLHYILN